MNLVVISGGIARDPDCSQKGDMNIAKFTLAVSRGKDNTDWIKVVAFDKTALLVHQYLKKGSRVSVEGRLQSSTYEYEGKKRTDISVIANRVEFLDRKGESQAPQTDSGYAEPDEAEDDIGDLF